MRITTAAKSANTTAHPVTTTVSRSMMTGTATRRAAAVTGHGPLQQTQGTAAVAVTRTSIARRARTVTEAEIIDAATAPDRPVLMTSTMTRTPTSMARRTPMVALDAGIEAATRIGIVIDRATDHVIRSVSETARTAKSESETMTTIARRTVHETKTRSAGVAATAKLKKKSANTMMTSTAPLAGAAKTETVSVATTTTVTEKKCRLLKRKKKTLLAR